MKYAASINIPGYLPMDDEPAVFDTPGEAWAYLADERKRAEEEDYAMNGGDEGFSITYFRLRNRAEDVTSNPDMVGRVGTIYGDTPGSDSTHDLGLAYSVDPVEDNT